MVKHRVVMDGQDPLTRPVLEYLDGTYGIPSEDIRAVTLESRTGDVQVVTVELMVRVPDASEDGLNHPGSDRWTGGDRKAES